MINFLNRIARRYLTCVAPIYVEKHIYIALTSFYLRDV